MNKKEIYKRLLIIMIGTFSFSAQAVFNYTSAVRPSVPSYSGQRGMTVKMITYNFLTETDITAVTTPLFPSLKVAVNGSKKITLLMGDKNDMERCETMIKALDIKPPVIQYSTYLVEINKSKLEQFGLNWQSLMEHWKTTRVAGLNEFMDQISSLMKNGEAKVLANPVITCLSNETAHIRIGDKIPYALPVEYSNKTGWQIQYMDAGIQFKVKGSVISENIIQTQVLTSISNVKEWRATHAGEYPVLSDREINLLCQLKNGETMMIGGLSNHFKRTNKSRMPLLADIPIIGSLFQTETMENQETEVVFLLMPEIKH